ncbi:MAG TPA: peptide deformylase [Alphaproteobacteria bacterium]|nr:peptide deformylase [Alphaproteobacteria bacterium]
MAVLNLVYAPNEIFCKKAEPVSEITNEIKLLVHDMLDTIYHEGAIGIGANMVGVLKRIVVVDLQVEGVRQPIIMINPEITQKSAETQTFTESSICFPFISAEIVRPKEIEVKFTDLENNQHTNKYEGFLATVIQHEIDYLNGITFLDHLSKLKKDTLLRKMQKMIKQNPPHIHGEHCHH